VEKDVDPFPPPEGKSVTVYDVRDRHCPFPTSDHRQLRRARLRQRDNAVNQRHIGMSGRNPLDIQH